MYSRSARVYDALFRQKDYRAAVDTVCRILERVAPHASSLLDVACGTGRHLAFFRERFEVEGVDLSPEMLDIARSRCPGVPLHHASLLDLHLGRRFDVVTCLFGSIGHARDLGGLEQAVTSMARHLNVGGALVVEPWVTPERFIAGKVVFDAVDDPDLKVARMYVTRREDRVSIFESEYLVGTAEGVSCFHERQELGLFSDDEYRAAFGNTGLEVVDASSDLFGYGLYVCRAREDQRRGNG